jgi:hypothetical protein
MKIKLVYVVGGIIIFSSLSKILGDGFQTNRQALIAGVLTAFMVGLICVEYFSKDNLKTK